MTTDADHTDDDNIGTFDIADDLPEAGTTLVIEASAGTGKTWTIASLVTRYVAEGVCTLDDMLIVTFGRAASQELRQRVREQLVAAGRVLASTGPPVERDHPAAVRPLVGLLLSGSDDERARRRLRVRAALANFDAATIATTHGFCQTVLAGLGVAGDTDSGAHLEEELGELLSEVVDDLYVRGFAGDSRPPVFSPAEAHQLARLVVGDPRARLEPAAALAPDADRGAPTARRLRFAQALTTELDRRKRRLGVMRYDDLLSQLDDALASPDSAGRRRMRDRWKVVLVDEFQDTDTVQWEVLDRAFSGHSTLILIGDPKQAIYAFRGGDVVTYLSATTPTATRPVVRRTLGTNQRSDAPLLDALQTAIQGAALGDQRIVVRAVTAAHHDSRLLGAPDPAPFRVRRVTRATLGESGTKPVTIARIREVVAADLAADLARLLDSRATFGGRPIQPTDVAIICAGRRQFGAIRPALSARGIRYVMGGSGSVLHGDAGTAWLALLRAIENPQRPNIVRAAGLTPFFGHSAEELDARGDDLTDELSETLRDWRTILRGRGVSAVVETIAADGAFASRVLAEPGGERAMTDLLHAGEALDRVSSREMLQLPALVSWLRRETTQQGEVSDERARRLDSDASAVQLLTIHGSKGLQFPVVYLPGVADRHVDTSRLDLRYRDEDDRRCLDVSGRATSEVRAKARDEDDGESLRLFYVAATRAQAQLVTWWFPSTTTSASPLHRLLFARPPGSAVVPATEGLPTDHRASELLDLWQREGGPCHQVVPDSADAFRVARVEEAAELARRRFTRQVDDVWTRTSYTRLSAAAAEAELSARPSAVTEGGESVLAPTSEPEQPLRDDEQPLRVPGLDVAAVVDSPPPASVPSPMADLPVGAAFGSLVHAVLEHADPAAPERGGDWPAELAHQVGEQLVRWPVDLGDDGRERLAAALVAVCDTPLGPLAATTLRQVSVADRMCELDFELPLAGGDDRTVPHRAGSLGGGGTVRDIAALLRRHLPAGDPLAPYAEAVDHPAYEQALRGYLAGSLDLVMRVDGRYVVCDYKTNWLGALDEPGDSGDSEDRGDSRLGGPAVDGAAPATGRVALSSDDYRPDRLAAAMNHSSYPLQALLYVVVLHRFLRWRVPDYDPARHLGGVLYLYVRGMCGPETPVIDGETCGVFSWRPPVALVHDLSDLLDGVVPTRPAGAEPTSPT